MSEPVTSQQRYPEQPLSAVCRRITDGSHFSPPPQEDGFLIANVKDMQGGAINLHGCTRISRTAFQQLVSSGCTIRDGHVLLSKDGTVGRVVVYSQRQEIGALSSICILEPTDSISPRYLGQALQSEICTRQYDNAMSGSALRRLVLRDIRAIRVPLPQPAQQSAIARILDILDTQIEKTQALIAKLEQVKEGLLHDLLTRGVDENGELRPSAEEAPELYKESALGLIPREWKASSTTAYLRDQDGIKPGPFGSSLKKESYTRTGFKVYGQEQVIAGDQSIGDYFISAAKFAELQDFEVREGDVLISLVGTVGRVLVLKPGCLPGLINPRLMRLRPNPSAVTSEFLRLILMSAGFTQQIEALAGGGTMPVINKSIVRRVVVPYVPLAEQVRIVQLEATTTRQLSDERAYRLKLQTEKSGLMNDLLTGRVRVTPLLDLETAEAT